MKTEQLYDCKPVEWVDSERVNHRLQYHAGSGMIYYQVRAIFPIINHEIQHLVRLTPIEVGDDVSEEMLGRIAKEGKAKMAKFARLHYIRHCRKTK